MYDLIREAIQKALTGRDTREPDTLTHVWASSLGYCPLRSSLSRRQTERVLPVDEDKSLASAWRMKVGAALAEVVQGAITHQETDWGLIATPQNLSIQEFMGGYDRIILGNDRACAAEITVQSDALLLKGRLDLLIREGNKLSVIEIKHHDVPDFVDICAPYYGDLMQVMAYKMMLEDLYHEMQVDAYILCLRSSVKKTTNFYNLWQLKRDIPTDPEWRGEFVAVNELGEIWNNPFGRSSINEDLVFEERNRHLAYLRGEKTAPPYANPVEQFECGSFPKGKPKDGKSGTFVAHCSYWCHTSPEAVRHGIEVKNVDGQLVSNLPMEF